jgi:hypothetical protein
VDSPYREPKALSEIIPPDRRRERVAILVITSMIAGAALWEVARWALEERDSSAALPPPHIDVVPTSTTSFEPAPPPPATTALTSLTSLTSEEVQRVVAAHRVGLKERCWDPQNGTASELTSVKVTLSLVVGAKGDVVAASATGTDALIASCVETQARAWMFPAHGERSPAIQIPFVFKRS